ncbi:ABC transporter permease [Psychrobacillus sp.]|uniref:ABC transporter permease n=1 Tax=Psychrobacillus sp. TaxID=1871623 RepID=UPI0028BE7E94|nr:ABC transporter permease [Psychrobacillus sp.]
MIKIEANAALKKTDTKTKTRKIKASSWVEMVPSKLWVVISLLVAILFWTILSVIPNTSRSFPNIFLVSESVITMLQRGVFWKDIASSLTSVVAGFLIGFVISLPVAVLMAWYRPIRFIIEPWIQFVRNIPPLAYVPLVVISAGVGRTPQIIVITIATFLTMSITIYHGVRNIDPTLVKAARVLGAKDKDIFMKVIVPASLPFIMTAIRLGTAVGLTSLIAAESTGASAGLGMRIRALNNTFESAPMLLYIIVIGIVGLIFERLVKLLERRFTGWQEKRE